MPMASLLLRETAHCDCSNCNVPAESGSLPHHFLLAQPFNRASVWMSKPHRMP
jgi:hypothetical protein